MYPSCRAGSWHGMDREMCSPALQPVGGSAEPLATALALAPVAAAVGSPLGCPFPGGPSLKPLLCAQEEKKVPPPIPKKPPRSKVHPVKERSLDSVDRQRQEARKRLLAAKRAASFRQSSATESADSIEIYIPEAQTRL